MSIKDSQDWAAKQLVDAKISPAHGKKAQEVYTSVRALLDVFFLQHHTPETLEKTVEVFSALARGHSILPEKEDAVWVPFASGLFKKGDTVRVKSEAFSGAEGRIHNGRVGVIADIRRGDVIFNSRDDRQPILVSQHYRPDMLEGRVNK